MSIRNRTLITSSIETRFWAKVKKTDGCWLWTAGTDVDGYGQLFLGRTESGKTISELAHRVSWKLHFGNLPEEICVLHTCDNPPCVKPYHLFTGTTADNMADKVKKGRSARGESHGKCKITDAQVIQIISMFKRGISRTTISEVFKISFQHVTRICNGDVRHRSLTS